MRSLVETLPWALLTRALTGGWLTLTWDQDRDRDDERRRRRRRRKKRPCPE